MPNAPTDLPPNDSDLIKAVQEGRFWEPGGELPTPAQLADPAFVAKMPAIQASTIRALCLGLWDNVTLDPQGVQIAGARIVGQLNLSFGKGRGPLTLLQCHLAEPLVVQNAHLPALALRGSHLVKGLMGDGVHIAGELFCDDGFTSKSEVRLLGAQIGGDAAFVGATLDGGTGHALNADRMVVTGGLFCTGSFTSKGAVRLLGAQIGGNAEFVGATLDGGTGDALSADGMVVTGHLFCNDGFSSKGEVRLLGAHIGGNAAFVGATLDGGTGDALNANRMVVTGSLFCRGGFESHGRVNFVNVKISGLLDWRPAKGSGTLNLSHATAGQWRDDWGNRKVRKGEAEPEKPSLNLNHFTYGEFFATDGMKTDSRTRIAWIKASQGTDFKPGPYRTLARVLRAAGDGRGAKDVGHAMEQARTKHQATSYHWSWRWLYRLWMFLFDLAVGHGYRPQWGAAWLFGWLVFGSLFFWLGAPTPYGGRGIIKPADPVFITQNHSGNPAEYSLSAKNDEILKRGHKYDYTLPVEYTPFSPIWYSFDTLIPLIDLGQEKAWSPSPLPGGFCTDFWGWLLLFYLYTHIIMGWVLSTLTVVAMTGLIKRDPEGVE